jgi:hypothetical protein
MPCLINAFPKYRNISKAAKRSYDSMPIPRVKGKRREVRRMLAQRSTELLAGYRRAEVGRGECPLVSALGFEIKGE